MFFSFFCNIFKKKKWVIIFLFFMIFEVDINDNLEICYKKVLLNEDDNCGNMKRKRKAYLLKLKKINHSTKRSKLLFLLINN
jgi:hypothetical protein